MKIIIYSFFSIYLLSAFTLKAQVQLIKPAETSDSKKDFIEQQSYLSENSLKDYASFYGDSLNGFDESAAKVQALNKRFQGLECHLYVKLLKRLFINDKYAIGPTPMSSPVSNAKIIGGTHVINTLPCVNEGFELSAPGTYSNANGVSGWTLSSRVADGQCSPTNWNAGSSEFSLVTTPILHPIIGIIPQSPFGGTVVAQLNDLTPNFNTTRLSTSFPVTTANRLFQFAYAGYWQDGNSGHLCCDQAAFKIVLKDCLGAVLTCASISLNPSTSSCPSGLTTYSMTTSIDFWSSWQVRNIDLTPYIGSCVTIDVISSDCSGGAHYGTTYFDAQCGVPFSSALPNNWSGPSLGAPVNFCPNSNIASLQAPVGYATYSWVAPNGPVLPAAQATLSALTVTNAIAGSVYTVYLTSFSGCIFVSTMQLLYSNVAISAIGSTPTCSLGTSGTAIVLASGSGSGYTYSWKNSANFVVGTSSVATSLSPGIYSITISSLGSSGCGTASGTVNVGTATTIINYVTKPVCNGEAYFLTSSGNNFHWYKGLTPTTPTLVSTSPSYTDAPASTNYYWSSYITTQGCKDSTRYSLVSALPGTISAVVTKPGCSASPGGGSAVITMTPSSSAPTGLNYYWVSSTGSTPFYSSSVNPTPSNTYTAVNLSANGAYSVSAFDGICKYNAIFVVGFTPLFNFTLTPTTSQTLCTSGPVLVNVILPSTTLSSQYTYSWSPNIFLFANNPALQQTIITPTAAPGTFSTIIYTVAVTSTLVSCAQTQTLAITIANLLPPIINPIPQLCPYSPVFTISANPSGGTYSNNSAVTASGLITPANALFGTNTFTYTFNVGSCVAVNSGSFAVGSPPSLTVSGNSSFCEGQSTTLLVGGANTYTWSNATVAPFITVSPTTNTTYSVVGFNAVTSCTNSGAITVTVMPLPNITISGDTSLCLGETTTLTANGSSSYLWNNGTAGQAITVTPAFTSTYTVQGANSLGTCFGTKTTTVYVKNCTDTGINQWSAEGGLNIYPNPTNGKLIIETKNEIRISLHNQLGQSLFEETIQKGIYNLDLSAYKTGLYFLTLAAEHSSKIIKLVKID